MDRVREIAKRLFDEGAIDEARLKDGLEIAEGAGLPLLRVLLHLKLADPKAVAKAITDVIGRPLVDLDRRPLPPSPIPMFTAALCRELRVFPLAFEKNEVGGQQLVLAMSDPTDRNAGERVAGLFGHDVRPVLVDDDALTRAIAWRYDPPPQEVTTFLLVDSLTDNNVPTDEGDPPSIEVSVDVVFDEPAPERTVVMRAPPVPPDATVVAKSPFLETSRSDQTATGSAFSTARVCFVSRDPKTRLRVAADLAMLVKEAIVLDDLQQAVDKAEKSAPDDIVVHGPKNDVTTGLLLDRLSRALGQGIVVISDDDTFSLLPCVRRRVAIPAGGPAAIVPVILEGFFT